MRNAILVVERIDWWLLSRLRLFRGFNNDTMVHCACLCATVLFLYVQTKSENSPFGLELALQ